jgi:hypothetical protein
MQLIDYDKYTRKWSVRTAVILAVIESIVTGFFLGMTLFESLRRGEVRTWLWPLSMAFVTGVGAIQTTLVALHNCPPTAKVNE